MWVHPRDHFTGKTDWSRVERCQCIALAELQNEDGLAMRGIVDFNARLDNLKHIANMGEIITAAQNLINKSAPPFLLICGGVGNGKTHIAQTVTRELNIRGQKTNYYSVKGLIDDLKKRIADFTINDYKSGLMRLNGLVLDDFGVNRGTDWELSELESIIDYRYQHRAITMMTTNMDLKQLNHISPRICSRFLDGYVGKSFVNLAPDYRAGNG